MAESRKPAADPQADPAQRSRKLPKRRDEPRAAAPPEGGVALSKPPRKRRPRFVL